MKNIDFDNADLGMFAFILSMIGLVVAVCLHAITEASFISLFSSCLVGIGTLANPKTAIQAIKRSIKKTAPTLSDPELPDHAR